MLRHVTYYGMDAIERHFGIQFRSLADRGIASFLSATAALTSCWSMFWSVFFLLDERLNCHLNQSMSRHIQGD